MSLCEEKKVRRNKMMSPLKLRLRRKNRQRVKIKNVNNGRFRLCVHRTNHNIYAQIIDDSCAKTLVSASTLCAECIEKKNGGNKSGAIFVGKVLAELAVKQNIINVVFDRSGFLYHGRIKALADSARENGLSF
jgi:large subunit ribosomal protein L18